MLRGTGQELIQWRRVYLNIFYPNCVRQCARIYPFDGCFGKSVLGPSSTHTLSFGVLAAFAFPYAHHSSAAQSIQLRPTSCRPCRATNVAASKERRSMKASPPTSLLPSARPAGSRNKRKR